MKSRRRLVTGTLTLAVGAGLLALLLIAGLQVVFAVSISTDFMQCANDDSPYPLGDCHWIGSILQAQNSVYLEGMSVPQRAIFDGIPATTGDVHALGISHQATKGGIHAYDFLTSWDQAIAAAGDAGFPFNDLHGQACGPEIGNQPDFATICSQLHGAYSFDVPLPGDPFLSKDGPTQPRLDAYEALYGPRTIRIYSNAPITGASVTLIHNVTDGNDTGDSYIDYTLTYTSTGTQLLVELAGHLSVTGDPNVNPGAWGVGLGASQIKGGPYHFNLGDLDGISLGNQDNQIKGADILIVPSELIVDKVTDPPASPQLFDFDLSTGTGDPVDAFSLADQDLPYQILLNPDTYSVVEIVPPGWDLTNAVCSDGSDPSAIGLDAGETVTCTFYDTQRGNIVVDKVTDPPGSDQSFEFSPSWGSNFFLTDADTPNDSGPLLPGTYSVSESVPTGWDLTDSYCDDGSPVSAIVLDPGETVICTFEDTQRGNIVVDKVTDPPGSDQSFEFSPSWGSNFFLTDADTPNDSGPLLPGTYSVSESVPAGWDLTDSYCDDGSPVSAIVLDPGETVICTFEDTRRGAIVVRKVTDPSPDLSNASFGFTAGGGLTPTGFSLGDGDSRSFGNLLPTDGYNVDETTIPSGWSLTTATCDDGSPVSNIDVAPGETVTCTFYNEATPVCIEIVKDGASCAHPGEEIIYSFKVHNCSDFDLENVTVTDPLWDPDLVELVGSLAADDGAAGGPDEYSFNEPYTVPSVFSGDLMPNTATVEGTDVLGRTVNDNDGHVVEILHPCIDVTKTHLPSKRANGDFLPGDKVTYVFKVTNCSSSTDLNNVTVVDEWVPPSPDSGQRFSKNLGSLGAGSNKGFSWVYTIPKDIDVEQNDVLVNRVTAFGVDDCDGTVDDAATDRVGLGQPRVHVPEWDSILLLASGLGPLAAYASMRFRKRR